MSYKLRQEAQTIRAEAERCLFCVEPLCVDGCPASVNVPQFIRHLRYGDIKSAKKVIKESNPFGGVCGYLCPSEDLCQSKCVRNNIDSPVKIRELQKYVCDHAEYSQAVVAPVGKKVAVVGAGPAGLACAHKLATKGVLVDIYDKRERLGGLVSSEIPEFRIPNEVVNRDISELVTSGVQHRLGVEVNPAKLEKLAEDYDAVFVGIGLNKVRESRIPCASSNKVFDSSKFLELSKSGMLKSISGSVYVIGGGDSAFDAAQTALKLGADRAVLVYRRSRKEMPATEESLIDSVKDGVEIIYNTSLLDISVSDALSLKFVQNRLVDARDGGRRTFEPLVGSEFTVKTEMLVFALGKTADEETLASFPVLGGKIFGGGDLVNGGKTIVEAVSQGMGAADSIIEFLKIEP